MDQKSAISIGNKLAHKNLTIYGDTIFLNIVKEERIR